MPGRRSGRNAKGRKGEAACEHPRLSPREIECLCWAAQDKSAGDIATIIGRSVHTVRQHLRRAYAKLGVHGRATAIERARELGFLKRPRRRPARKTE